MIRALCKVALESVVFLAIVSGALVLILEFCPKMTFGCGFGIGKPGVDAVTFNIQMEKIHKEPVEIIQRQKG